MPPENWKNSVLSNVSLSIASVKSNLRGPTGESQKTDAPIEVRKESESLILEGSKSELNKEPAFT